MRIFVASWFFPPSTSSEGIVAYKLLRNSRHTYDVCSSSSKNWSYGTRMEMEADNIEVFPIETDELEVWAAEAVKLFEKRHAEQPYDAIMTRSMPPDSILVGWAIRLNHPEIPWIASLADPVAKEPYNIVRDIQGSGGLNEQEKAEFTAALWTGVQKWRDHPDAAVRQLCDFKEMEDYAIGNASALIFPGSTLRSYVLAGRRRANAYVVPHTFDRSLYADDSELAPRADDRLTITFLGHSDPQRSLEPIVRAVNFLRLNVPEYLDKLHFRFIGHVPAPVRALIANFYLHDCITVESSVDYITSLKIMQESDWLLHIDANFEFLSRTGGSIYFAGKIADYMGTDTPILAVTGAHSPAYEIVRRAGGVCVEQDDIGKIADVLMDIVDGRVQPQIDRAFRDGYDAVNVARDYDKIVDDAVAGAVPFNRTEWPVVEGDPDAGKFLTICVPSYKVEAFLDRNLYSLITSPVANRLEVLVVNDGSPDSSREIGLAYQEHYPGIVRVIDKQNGGHGSTINAALEQATGLYFRVVDGDDWLDGKNLAATIEVIEKERRYADLISSDYNQVFCEDGAMVPWTMKGWAPGGQRYAYYDIIDFAGSDLTNEYFTIHSSMMKTQLLRDAGFKIQEHTYYVDVEYTLFPVPYIKTVMFTPEPIYRYAVGNSEQSINPEVFVGRYDHHDRVMRRMVKYFEDMRPQMGPGQVAYMRSQFADHLLETHYTLGMLWDSDKERGFARSRDFDEFLRETSPELYEAVGAEYRMVAAARKVGFDPKQTGSFETVRGESLVHKVLNNKVVRKGLHVASSALQQTEFGNKLVHSSIAEKIGVKYLWE